MSQWIQTLRIFSCAVFLASFGVLQAASLKFVAQDYPPFFYKETPDAKEISGAGKELTQTICERLSMVCTFEIRPLARIMVSLKDGDADGVVSITNSPELIKERLEVMNMSDPVFLNNNTFHGIKGEAKPFKSPTDLNGWSIATIRSATSERKMKALIASGVNIDLFSEYTISIALKKLAEHHYGPIDKSAVLFSEPVVLFYANKLGISLDTLYTYPQKQFFSNGFSKKLDPKIVQDFNKVLSEMKKNGELKKIALKYNVTPADDPRETGGF